MVTIAELYGDTKTTIVDLFPDIEQSAPPKKASPSWALTASPGEAQAIVPPGINPGPLETSVRNALTTTTDKAKQGIVTIADLLGGATENIIKGAKVAEDKLALNKFPPYNATKEFAKGYLMTGPEEGKELNPDSARGLGYGISMATLGPDDISKALMLAPVVMGGLKIKKGAEALAKTGKAAEITPELFNPTKYVAQNVAKQVAARATEPKGIGFLSEFKRKMIDFAAPIEDALGGAEAKYKFQVLPEKDVRLQIDRVLRAPTLAGQFARDNGLEQVIKHVDNIDNLDQYMIAKHGQTLAAKGIETGRDLAKDVALVKSFAPKYEPMAKQVRDYSNKLLDYVTDGGLISKGLNKTLKAEYPDYVPMNRIMGELDNVVNPGRSGVASVGKQSVVQAIKGSKKEVESPLSSLLTKTDTAFNQAERNKAAQMIATYEKLPGNPFSLVPLRTAENVEQRIDIWKNLKLLRPVRESINNTLSSLRTHGRRIKSELNQLNKEGLEQYLKRTSSELLGNKPSAIKTTVQQLPPLEAQMDKMIAPIQAQLRDIRIKIETTLRINKNANPYQGTNLFALETKEKTLAKQLNNILNEYNPAKVSEPRTTIARQLVSANYSPKEIKDIVNQLANEPPEAIAMIRKKIAGRDVKLNKVFDYIEEFNGYYKQLKDITGGLFDEAKALRDAEAKGKSTITFFKNGIKEIWETTPEIAQAAKNLNAQQMNILMQVLAAPIRIAKAGITGLYTPFIASNILKDQGLTMVTSRHGLATSIANPFNFVRSLFSVLKHDDLYEQMVRAGAGGTSFDIARNQARLTIDAIRANRNVGSKVAYVVRHPSELLRAVENVIGRSEELTRMTQFRGTRQALLKEGRNAQQATLLAAQAARENSANFARRGEWGQVLNAAFLYLNAGIQGSRSLVKSLVRQPIRTSAKIAATVFTPVAMTTLWNISDPKRLEAYKDIPEYEKNMNLIIIPPNPTKDSRGRWNVIKIPLAFGVGGLGYAVRKPIEQANNIDTFKVADMAQQVFSAVSPVDPEPGPLLSTALPHAIKGEVEWATNKDLFTSMPIVPEKMKNVPPAEQTRPGTSGTANALGKLLNVSPLQVEHYVRAKVGGLGSQLLHASDLAANKMGLLPKEKIGGESLGEGFARRFARARGGETERKVVEGIMSALGKQATQQLQTKQQAELIWEKLSDTKVPIEERNQLLATIPPKNKLYDNIKKISKDEQLGITYSDRLLKQLQTENGARAIYIVEKIATMKRVEAQDYLNGLQKKKIITPAVQGQIAGLIPQLVEREKKKGRKLWQN